MKDQKIWPRTYTKEALTIDQQVIVDFLMIMYTSSQSL